MTPPTLTTLRALLAKATAEKWIVDSIKTTYGVCFKIGPPEIVKQAYGGICLYDDQTSLNPHPPGQQKANAALIVFLCNHAEALAQVVETGERLAKAIELVKLLSQPDIETSEDLVMETGRDLDKALLAYRAALAAVEEAG